MLGRLLELHTGDRLRAEALYLFVVTTGTALYLLTVFASWSLFGSRITADPDGRIAVLFWTAQVLVAAVGVLFGGIGFRKRIRVRVDDNGIRIERGSERVDLPFDSVEEIEVMDGVSYHRRIRRLAVTRPYVNRPVPRILLIRSNRSIVALGLPETDLARMIRLFPENLRPAQPAEVSAEHADHTQPAPAA
jgi:hypothetical protein